MEGTITERHDHDGRNGEESGRNTRTLA